MKKTTRRTIPGTVYWEKETLGELKSLSKRLNVPMQVIVRVAMRQFLVGKKNIKWLGVK